MTVPTTPEPATGTCGTCKHWKPPSDRDDYRNVVRDDDADMLFGVCQVITLHGSFDPTPDPLPLAVTMDGSEYKADLMTQEAFGCAMWEAKP